MEFPKRTIYGHFGGAPIYENWVGVGNAGSSDNLEFGVAGHQCERLPMHFPPTMSIVVESHTVEDDRRKPSR